MTSAKLAAFALATLVGTGTRPSSLILELRVFDGIEDVTAQTRVAVHKAGERGTPVAKISTGHSRIETEIAPGIYDVQVIRERDDRVISIRWAQRLVVMPYPDENGRHLEVINFQNGFGALELRGRDGLLPDLALYKLAERQKPVATPSAGDGILLFVLPAGVYDLQVRRDSNVEWQRSLEVPLDRTRLRIVP
jgi:hypothetical protein